MLTIKGYYHFNYLHNTPNTTFFGKTKLSYYVFLTFFTTKKWYKGDNKLK